MFVRVLILGFDFGLQFACTFIDFKLFRDFEYWVMKQ